MSTASAYRRAIAYMFKLRYEGHMGEQDRKELDDVIDELIEAMQRAQVCEAQTADEAYKAASETLDNLAR